MPDPRNYRVILRETMNKLRQKSPSQEARDILIDIFLDGEDDTVETVFRPMHSFLVFHVRQWETINSIPKRLPTCLSF